MYLVKFVDTGKPETVEEAKVLFEKIQNGYLAPFWEVKRVSNLLDISMDTILDMIRR